MHFLVSFVLLLSHSVILLYSSQNDYLAFFSVTKIDSVLPKLYDFGYFRYNPIYSRIFLINHRNNCTNHFVLTDNFIFKYFNIKKYYTFFFFFFFFFLSFSISTVIKFTSGSKMA